MCNADGSGKSGRQDGGAFVFGDLGDWRTVKPQVESIEGQLGLFGEEVDVKPADGKKGKADKRSGQKRLF